MNASLVVFIVICLVLAACVLVLRICIGNLQDQLKNVKQDYSILDYNYKALKLRYDDAVQASLIQDDFIPVDSLKEVYFD